MTPDSRRKCAQCGGTNMIDGRIAQHERFIPKGRIFSLGYGITASACLDCGSVQHRLDDEQLAKMKEKLG